MADRFDPADPKRYSGWVGMGYSYFFQKRFDDAASWALRAVELSPTFTPGIRLAITSLAHLGRLAEAREMAINLMQLQPGSRVSRYRKTTTNTPGWLNSWLKDFFSQASLNKWLAAATHGPSARAMISASQHS